jgi:thymidylate synthase
VDENTLLWSDRLKDARSESFPDLSMDWPLRLNLGIAELVRPKHWLRAYRRDPPRPGVAATSVICLIQDSLDDLLHAAIEAVLERGEHVSPTKGPNRELRAVTLELTNPRARLSRSESRGKIFSALGELLWYLSGSNATGHITHYIPRYSEYDEGGIIFGGYGPRLRGGTDQLATVVDLLRSRPSTRRAVLQIFDRTDLLEPHEDVPCTCTLQFLHRERGLDLIVYMRSNDVFIGLPHDVFCFSMIQELVARSVGAQLGQYIHVAGSLHLYDEDVQHARQFLDEGYFETNEMPPMPDGDVMTAVDEILATETQLRAEADPRSVSLPTDPYWADLARLLVAFQLDRRSRRDEIASVMEQMSTDVYNLHVADRLDRTRRNR